MSQQTRKYIEDDAVNGQKIRLDNNENLKGRNNANNANVPILKVSTADVPEFQTLPTVNAALAVPTSPKQLATLEYIQNYVVGKNDSKDAVNVLADSQVALTGSTTLTIDGQVVQNGWRVALTGQTTASQNGIYDAAIAGANWTLTRSSDFDQVADASGREVTSGAFFKVISGTTYSGWEAILSTPDPIVVGTTSLAFTRNPTVAALTGGDMIAKSGNDLSVDLATNGGLESTNPGNSAGQLRVKTRTADLEKDRTVRIDATGNLVAKKSKKMLVTLSAGNITAQYLDLPDVAEDGSVRLQPAGAGEQIETLDFTVNYTGGTASKTRVLFAGGLATGGVSALVAGEVVVVTYRAD